MALVSSRWNDRYWDDSWPAHETVWRDRFWNDRNWNDWPRDWPRPREIVPWFRHNSDRWWRDWPSDWPRMDAIMPRFTSQLDRFDSNWRQDPFWRDLYPRWAEPIFKEGIDVKTTITNDSNRFAVDMETYQFRPEELQVKTMDDTLLIEGRHEDVKDRDNYTRMFFVRKYQIPFDVDPQNVTSSIDSRGRLLVEAPKRQIPYDGHERAIPIESSAGYFTPRSRGSSPRGRHDSGRGSEFYRGGSGNGAGGYASKFLSPNPDRNYRTGYSTQSADANGMRHESHREEFREMRRSGSPHSIPPPIVPLPMNTTREENYRSESRHSGFHRSGSNSRNEYSSPFGGGENLLRPSNEMDGAARPASRGSESYRNVHISRTFS